MKKKNEFTELQNIVLSNEPLYMDGTGKSFEEINNESHYMSVKDKYFNLTSSEIEEIKNFVRNNKDLLLQLSDTEIDFGDFLDNMKVMEYV